MRKRTIQIAAVLLAAALCIPTLPASHAVRENDDGEIMIRVGLASSSSHNDQGEMACAHLENNTGYGAGYRFGYYDDALNFVELGRTDEGTTKVSVMKTQNLYYGRDPAQGKTTYSSAITSDIAVGCYHIVLPGTYETFQEAADAAAAYEGGFPAWIGGSYQARIGAYTNGEAAAEALSVLEVEGAEVMGTSKYGISVVKTGTAQILFQFDDETRALGILPDVTGAEDVRTWFSGYKYRGGFTYRRVTGGDLTVVNVLGLEDYVKGVTPYEMGRLWPLEALKTQAVCARTYVLKNLDNHKSLGFDVCNTASCQAYHGVGTQRTDYGESEVSAQAVEETANQVVWYDGKLAATYYSSSHGGASEEVANVWTSNKVGDYPYLCGVIDPYESGADSINSRSSWTVTYTSSQLQSRLQSYGYGVNTSLKSLELVYSKLGNVIKVIVHWSNGQSNTITPSTGRGMRSIFGLNSIRFTVNGQTVNSGTTSSSTQETSGGYAVNGSGTLESVEGVYVVSDAGTVAQAGEDLYTVSGSGTVEQIETEGEEETSGDNVGGGTVTVSDSSYAFKGSGWGHQIGMSQFGAYAMAKLDFTYDEILEFYYPGTNVDDYR